MGKAIGIDLGTTFSCMATMEAGSPVVVSNQEGGRTTPSVVAFTEEGRLVGNAARRQAVANPENTVHAVKRLMGRKFDTPEVKRMGEVSGYRIASAANGDAHVSALKACAATLHVCGRKTSTTPRTAHVFTHSHNLGKCTAPHLQGTERHCHNAGIPQRTHACS